MAPTTHPKAANTACRSSPRLTSSPTTPTKVTKTRPSRTSPRNTRQLQRLLRSQDSTDGAPTQMYDEEEDVAAGASGSDKGKGKSKLLEPDPGFGGHGTMDVDDPEDITHCKITREEDEENPSKAFGGHQTMDVDDPEDITHCTIKREEESLSDTTTGESQLFPIMDLPTEIRLEILRACLTRPYNILLSKREQPPPPSEQQDVDSDALDTLSDQEADDGGILTSTNHTFRPMASSRRFHLASGLRGSGPRASRPLQLLSSRSVLAPAPVQAASSTTPIPAAGSSINGVLLPAIRSARARRIGANGRNVVPTTEPPRNQSTDPLIVNVLRLNSEIYREARGVLYGENKFTLDLQTAIPTLYMLHQRSRRQIKHVELEIPTYNEILEKFQETVRLSLRYCSGLKKFIIHMPFTLPGADGSGTTGNTTVYANGFDILRWLPQQCDVELSGNSCKEIETVVNKHLHLAKTLQKLAYARRQLISNDTGGATVPA